MDQPKGGSADETRRLIVNPASGQGDHAERVRGLATEYGFSVEETERSGHAIELAEQAAADGVDLLGACGGDGTVHEVVQGLVAADALDAVTLCIVPAGTANIVATELGIDDMRDGFEIADRGETRRLDLGVADDEPFVMSAIAGLPAEASAAASSELKERFGTFAFVIERIQETRTFDGLRMEIHATSESEEIAWSGEALSLLIGNLRRFSKAGGQANAEDGLLEVSIVEQMPSIEAVTEAIEQRLLHQETPHVTNLTATRLDIAGLDGTPVTFSLDGEIRTYTEVRISIRPQVLSVRVGETYTSKPDEDAT